MEGRTSTKSVTMNEFCAVVVSAMIFETLKLGLGVAGANLPVTGCNITGSSLSQV
jgi:hypothetical protein